MKKSLTTIIMLLFFLGIVSQIWSEIPESVVGLHDRAYEMYINGNYTSSDFTDLLENFLTEVAVTADQAEAFYWRGKTAYLKGLASIAEGNKTDAEIHLNEAVRIAGELKRFLELEYSYSLESNAKAQIMLIKGVPYIIRNAGEVQKLAERALELNPDNIQARLIVASGKLNAPKFFGGDTTAGINLLEQTLADADRLGMGRIDRYSFYLVLGSAYKKNNKKDKARSSLQQALSLFPESREARMELAGL
jgi:tetratricopeptide (TPR) repeat protein